MLKELRNLWEKDEHDLPRENREFSESNTLLLLDDSPYMALLNPVSSLVLFSFYGISFTCVISFFLLFFFHFIYAIYFQKYTGIFPNSYQYEDWHPRLIIRWDCLLLIFFSPFSHPAFLYLRSASNQKLSGGSGPVWFVLIFIWHLSVINSFS